MLALQPIKPEEAAKLDRKIATKIHDLLGFPFYPNSNILMLPIKSMGFEFPSIAKINMALAVEGIARDLNHHIPTYRTMARITLADWTCSINGCRNPLDGSGLHRNFSRYWNKIPGAWIVGQEGMNRTSISLRATDYSFITKGEVSISHLCNLMPGSTETTHGRLFKSLRARGVQWVHQTGYWTNGLTLNIHDAPPFPIHRRIDQPGNAAWEAIKGRLEQVNLTECIHGSHELLESKDYRRTKVETYIRAMANRSNLEPSSVLGPNDVDVWASDGSMRPATSDMFKEKTVTCAITGPKTLAMRVQGKGNSILQGELMGLIGMATISSSSGKGNKGYTDHLNTSRLISDHREGGNTEAKLRHMPARSYYRWLLALTDENCNMEIEYTPGHASNLETAAARLNHEADHYASKASYDKFVQGILYAPTPTFFMDDFTFYSEEFGWIESNIKTVITSITDRNIFRDLSSGHQLRMAQWLYETTSIPTYPYTRSPSAYSAAVQLYARSGQLPTADGLRRKNKRTSNLCRLGCQAIEDEHHVFSVCPIFDAHRTEATKQVKVDTLKLLEKDKKLEELEKGKIMETAKSLFIDNSSWPLKHTQYYLGHVPQIDHLILSSNLSWVDKDRLRRNLQNLWHSTAIRLAGRIWGDMQRRMAVQSGTRRKGFKP